jgi:hypothetical protein
MAAFGSLPAYCALLVYYRTGQRGHPPMLFLTGGLLRHSCCGFVVLIPDPSPAARERETGALEAEDKGRPSYPRRLNDHTSPFCSGRCIPCAG